MISLDVRRRESYLLFRSAAHGPSYRGTRMKLTFPVVSELATPPAPRLRTAEELFGSATNWARTNNPLAYGAREGALADINRPEFYSGFQPTSMDQALG